MFLVIWGRLKKETGKCGHKVKNSLEINECSTSYLNHFTLFGLKNCIYLKKVNNILYFYILHEANFVDDWTFFFSFY